MSTIVRLVCGGKVFELNDGTRFMVPDGKFIPPGADVRLSMTGKRGSAGGRVAGVDLSDRDWSFQVLALGDNLLQTSLAVGELQAFLTLTGGREKLYLEYCLNPAIPYRPTWGQAGWHRYEVKYGQMKFARFGAESITASLVEVMLVIGPHKLGLEQVALQGTGGLLEDRIGVEDGTPRGVMVLGAATNLFTNPVFPVEARNDWDYGWTWTLDAELEMAPENILFGSGSARVLRQLAANGNCTQSLNAGNTNTWCLSGYFKRADGAAVTDATVKMYYNGSARTTSFVEMGNGWYLGYANVTGVASATTAGCQIQVDDVVVYLDGFMFAEGAGPQVVCYGDMPGCQWSGTAHKSSTTRTAGSLHRYWSQLLTPDNHIQSHYTDQVSIRAVARWNRPSTYGSNQYLFSGQVSAYLHAADDKIYLTDGTNTISTAAQSISTGDVMALHFVCSLGLMKIYINGELAASGSAFDPIDTGTEFYLGSTSTPASQGEMTFLDLTLWNETLTATQVEEDYTEIWQHVGDGRLLNTVPWCWTYSESTGAGVLHMYQDSTHMDTAILGGVAGDEPAETTLWMLNSATGKSLVIGLNAAEEILPIRDEFEGFSTTNAAAVNTSEVDLPTSGNEINLLYERRGYWGKQAYLFAVMTDAGANLRGRLKVERSTSYVYAGDYKTLAADATYRQFLLGPVLLDDGMPAYFDDYFAATYLKLKLGLYRTASGSANVTLDWYRALVGKVAYIAVSDSLTDHIVIVNGKAMGAGDAGAQQTEPCLYQGDEIALEPRKYNYLTVLSGNQGAATTSTLTTSLLAVVVRPRWRLL